MDFSKRSTVEEHMDNPILDKESYKKAYKDINRCNTLLGGSDITIKAIRKLIDENPQKSYTIMDMGCGDGHMLRLIAKRFRGRDIKLHLVGIDLRDDVITVAREASQDFPEILFQEADILDLTQVQDCDILLCTLTMHHFEEADIKTFGRRFGELAKLGVVINDLQRSKVAYHLFKLFSFFFVKTKIAKEDGLISISKSFRRHELQQIADTIEGLRHTITWKWAFRYLWTMQPLQAQ
ncbi:MAG: methyltransferase domain-containing protein [Croceivirga sp.]